MSWILTLSPGAKVRVVESENERGASFALAGIAAAVEKRRRSAACSGLGRSGFRRLEIVPIKFRRFIEFLAECSSGRRQESWDCRRAAAIAAGDGQEVPREARGEVLRADRDRALCRRRLQRPRQSGLRSSNATAKTGRIGDKRVSRQEVQSAHRG